MHLLGALSPLGDFVNARSSLKRKIITVGEKLRKKERVVCYDVLILCYATF